MAADPKISELAQLIESKPGWSFELILVGEPERVDSSVGAHAFGGEAIIQRMEQAEKSLGVGMPEAAFLLAWSACEALIREMIAAEGISDTRITSPRFILDQAVFRGVISREEYENLAGMLKYRNTIVHGFYTDDFSAEFVTGLMETVRRISISEAEDGEVRDE